MGFASVLHPGESSTSAEQPAESLSDLHLDALFEAVVNDLETYDLGTFYRHLPVDIETVRYRQDVMEDVARPEVEAVLHAFAEGMSRMREAANQAEELYHPMEKQRWHLQAVVSYLDATADLSDALARLRPRSAGLQAFAEFLGHHVADAQVREMNAERHGLLEDLDAVRFGLLIAGDKLTVRPPEVEPDYTQLIQSTFERFRTDANHDYRTNRARARGLDHIEVAIVERAAKLHPSPFQRLALFQARYKQFADTTVERFDREIQFFLAWLQLTRRLESNGLAFTRPKVVADGDGIRCRDGFDIALALTLGDQASKLVRNDVDLSPGERIMVVSGPNQGGKTTFARMVGQMHHLAALGLTVPGTEVEVPLIYSVLTHFERAEHIDNLRGKLHDDLTRMRALLEKATATSLIVMNEAFASTTLEDATLLNRRILGIISRIGAMAVCVSFINELSRFDSHTVSIVGGVDNEDPLVRTFKLTRRPADGQAHAVVLAAKFGLNREAILERVTT